MGTNSLSVFKQDMVPVNVVFLVDASYSVTDVLPRHPDAAVTFAGHPRKGDKFRWSSLLTNPSRFWTGRMTSIRRRTS